MQNISRIMENDTVMAVAFVYGFTVFPLFLLFLVLWENGVIFMRPNARLVLMKTLASPDDSLMTDTSIFG